MSDGIVGIIPAVLATGLTLWTLGEVEKIGSSHESTGLYNMKHKSLQDMF